ncbi:fluoride efflux transporter CrcB [Stenomitos frigidus]|uniref:Fluoride-specific ion channel FluC n=1 Tax=Stenomitos frigidus ULC18 TaxID=2107698 RepID=A0A2T1E5V5_9CYAN|nr:fluoride efflux transporter CrcB [Stenomitos frigidus]PSB28132.1 fluoride efflux transporter CrcB [Stenomitos frigidus ULC18]
MLVTLLHHVLNGLGKTLGLLSAIDPSLRAPFAVILGAIPGALSRYYLTLFFARWLGASFPYGTFVINLTGAMVMGFFITLTLERTMTSPELRLLVATGFLGSYTTFSSYELDTFNLLQSGNRGLALVYWLGSAVLGFLSLELGNLLARRVS